MFPPITHSMEIDYKPQGKEICNTETEKQLISIIKQLTIQQFPIKVSATDFRNQANQQMENKISQKMSCVTDGLKAECGLVKKSGKEKQLANFKQFSKFFFLNVL